MQNYNLILDVKDREQASPGLVEPVTLTEIKNYIRLQSWEDDLGSTADITFTGDDDLIEEMITSARGALEKYTGLSFIPKELRVTFTNLAGLIELPFGPIGDVQAYYYGCDFEEDGEAATDYSADLVLSGSEFKRIVSPRGERDVIDYSCGYGRGDTPPLPKSLKQAIMAEVFYRYEHRGDEFEDDGICKAAKRLADPYKRTSWLA